MYITFVLHQFGSFMKNILTYILMAIISVPVGALLPYLLIISPIKSGWKSYIVISVSAIITLAIYILLLKRLNKSQEENKDKSNNDGYNDNIFINISIAFLKYVVLPLFIISLIIVLPFGITDLAFFFLFFVVQISFMYFATKIYDEHIKKDKADVHADNVFANIVIALSKIIVLPIIFDGIAFFALLIAIGNGSACGTENHATEMTDTTYMESVEQDTFEDSINVGQGELPTYGNE